VPEFSSTTYGDVRPSGGRVTPEDSLLGANLPTTMSFFAAAVDGRIGIPRANVS
jgi:hypothetical protein